MRVVFCDVDGVLREDKVAPVPLESYQAITAFQEAGNIFNMITGAPLAHVPNLPAHIIFAEAGGVLVRPKEEGGLQIFEPGRQKISQLRQCLGIFAEDGMVETSLGSIIIEGPRRHTSLTFLVGRPPHYPGCITSAKIEEVISWVEELVKKLALPLSLSIGHDTSYSYSDIFSMTKGLAIQTAMQLAGWSRAYVAGDKFPDYEAMLLPGVIPVGFANSIKKIRDLARERGVYIDLPGPTGGLAEFFRQVNSERI